MSTTASPRRPASAGVTTPSTQTTPATDSSALKSGGGLRKNSKQTVELPLPGPGVAAVARRKSRSPAMALARARRKEATADNRSCSTTTSEDNNNSAMAAVQSVVLRRRKKKKATATATPATPPPAPAAGTAKKRSTDRSNDMFSTESTLAKNGSGIVERRKTVVEEITTPHQKIYRKSRKRYSMSGEKREVTTTTTTAAAPPKKEVKSRDRGAEKKTESGRSLTKSGVLTKSKEVRQVEEKSLPDGRVLKTVSQVKEKKRNRQSDSKQLKEAVNRSLTDNKGEDVAVAAKKERARKSRSPKSLHKTPSCSSLVTTVLYQRPEGNNSPQQKRTMRMVSRSTSPHYLGDTKPMATFVRTYTADPASRRNSKTQTTCCSDVACARTATAMRATNETKFSVELSDDSFTIKKADGTCDCRLRATSPKCEAKRRGKTALRDLQVLNFQLTDAVKLVIIPESSKASSPKAVTAARPPSPSPPPPLIEIGTSCSSSEVMNIHYDAAPATVNEETDSFDECPYMTPHSRTSRTALERQQHQGLRLRNPAASERKGSVVAELADRVAEICSRTFTCEDLQFRPLRALYEQKYGKMADPRSKLEGVKMEIRRIIEGALASASSADENAAATTPTTRRSLEDGVDVAPKDAPPPLIFRHEHWNYCDLDCECYGGGFAASYDADDSDSDTVARKGDDEDEDGERRRRSKQQRGLHSIIQTKASMSIGRKRKSGEDLDPRSTKKAKKDQPIYRLLEDAMWVYRQTSGRERGDGSDLKMVPKRGSLGEFDGVIVALSQIESSLKRYLCESSNRKAMWRGNRCNVLYEKCVREEIDCYVEGRKERKEEMRVVEVQRHCAAGDDLEDGQGASSAKRISLYGKIKTLLKNRDRKSEEGREPKAGRTFFTRLKSKLSKSAQSSVVSVDLEDERDPPSTSRDAKLIDFGNAAQSLGDVAAYTAQTPRFHSFRSKLRPLHSTTSVLKVLHIDYDSDSGSSGNSNGDGDEGAPEPVLAQLGSSPSVAGRRRPARAGGESSEKVKRRRRRQRSEPPEAAPPPEEIAERKPAEEEEVEQVVVDRVDEEVEAFPSASDVAAGFDGNAHKIRMEKLREMEENYYVIERGRDEEAKPAKTSARREESDSFCVCEITCTNSNLTIDVKPPKFPSSAGDDAHKLARSPGKACATQCSIIGKESKSHQATMTTVPGANNASVQVGNFKKKCNCCSAVDLGLQPETADDDATKKGISNREKFFKARPRSPLAESRSRTRLKSVASASSSSLKSTLKPGDCYCEKGCQGVETSVDGSADDPPAVAPKTAQGCQTKSRRRSRPKEVCVGGDCEPQDAIERQPTLTASTQQSCSIFAALEDGGHSEMRNCAEFKILHYFRHMQPERSRPRRAATATSSSPRPPSFDSFWLLRKATEAATNGPDLGLARREENVMMFMEALLPPPSHEEDGGDDGDDDDDDLWIRRRRAKKCDAAAIDRSQYCF